MISLYYTTENRFSLFGIRHFMEKTGIPFQINKPSQSGIVIAYGCKARGDFVISVEENDIQNTICGKISTLGDKIPLCEIPHDTGIHDEVIVYFEKDTTRFPCTTQKDRGISIGVDIFKETGYLLSGHLDSFRSSLESPTQKELASKPIVDVLENILFEAILAGCRKTRIPLVQKSYWPDGKKFAVCLTHDVDEIKKTYQWITHPLRFILRGNLAGLKAQIDSFLQKINGVEPYYTYDDIIRIEQDLGVKSTYFILKESGNASLFSKETWYLYGRNRSFQSPDMRALIKRLQLNGDEIAIHGSYYSYKDPVLLQREIQELEQIINEKVIGSRQHNLNLDVPNTWKYQILCGLKYDTTLGFNGINGFRWGTSFPFFPYTTEGILPLLEIPLILMDICLEFSTNKEAECLQIANEAQQYFGVISLLWHPPVFNRFEYRDACNLYMKINQNFKENGGWFAKACDIYHWMCMRNLNVFFWEYDKFANTCTICPNPSDYPQFFTLFLPLNDHCTIRSENADIIRRDENYMYIRTHDLTIHNEIIIEMT